MPTWPASLPCAPISSTLRIRPETNVVQFQTDVGRPQRRRRYPQQRLLYSGTIKCTTVQKEVLMAFFSDDCVDGVNSFEMEDWDKPAGIVSEGVKTFTFVTEPDFEKTGPNRWFINLELAREN